MAFSGRKDEIGKVGSGEIIGNVGTVSTYTTFEDGLKGGLFSKYNSTTGGVELVDGSATPTIAGVVKREVSSAIEDGGTYTADNSVIADVIESGTITVTTVSGLTINKFEPVYVYNDATTADQGKATNTAGTANVLVDGYFYENVDTDVWTIRIK